MSSGLKSRINTTLPLIAVALCLLACATTQSRFAPLDGKVHPPKAANFDIAVFETEPPRRAFERIARLDVHLEKTGFTLSTLEEAKKELTQQARAAGADAIIDIKEQRSSVGETRILHVTATAILYTSP